ncbi:acyl-CoA dehydrogenase [Tistrella bauzanensis]
MDVLRRIGRASLPVARLVEGHMNAVKLVALYGDAPMIGRVSAAVRDGCLMGVWAADDATPLTGTVGVTGTVGADGRVTLTGGKRFASGLGLVGLAVVSLRPADGPTPDAAAPRPPPPSGGGRRHRSCAARSRRLDGRRHARHRLGPHRSGRGHAGRGRPAGRPGAYGREPHFEGGIWRYCAAHIGGAEALISVWHDRLAAAGRLDDPLQLTRFARAVALCRASLATVREAAIAAEAAAGGPVAVVDHAVAGCLLARQTVEEMCVAVLALAETSLGMQAHDRGSDIERLRRDLSLFIRQAAPDAKLLAAGRILAARAADGRGLW